MVEDPSRNLNSPLSPGGLGERVQKGTHSLVMGDLVWDCPSCPGTTPEVRSYQMMTIFCVQGCHFPSRIQKNKFLQVPTYIHAMYWNIQQFFFFHFTQILAECYACNIQGTTCEYKDDWSRQHMEVAPSSVVLVGEDSYPVCLAEASGHCCIWIRQAAI